MGNEDEGSGLNDNNLSYLIIGFLLCMGSMFLLALLLLFLGYVYDSRFGLGKFFPDCPSSWETAEFSLGI